MSKTNFYELADQLVLAHPQLMRHLSEFFIPLVLQKDAPLDKSCVIVFCHKNHLLLIDSLELKHDACSDFKISFSREKAAKACMLG
jgi:hypothetical protein